MRLRKVEDDEEDLRNSGNRLRAFNGHGGSDGCLLHRPGFRTKPLIILYFCRLRRLYLRHYARHEKGATKALID